MQIILHSAYNNSSDNLLLPIQEQLPIKLGSIDIFDDRNRLNIFRIFYAYYAKVPSSKTIDKLQNSRMLKWMVNEMKDQIIYTHTYEFYGRRCKCMLDRFTIYILKNELLIKVENDEVEILYASGNAQSAQELLDAFKPFRLRAKRTTYIHTIFASYHSLATIPVEIKKPKLDIDTHYNDDLSPVHLQILSNLKKKNSKGLYLLYGCPGTGKSTYLRFLIHHLKKKVIFMSPAQAKHLDSPELNTLLIENMDAVIVIEDAEELIMSRDTNRVSGISTLLNLSDGLLSESLGIQIIATFNTNISNIDKALLRKGRLTTLYEFKELSIAKSASLIATLGFADYNVTRPMTLAEIYNIEKASFQLRPQRNAIGFTANNN